MFILIFVLQLFILLMCNGIDVGGMYTDTILCNICNVIFIIILLFIYTVITKFEKMLSTVK